MNVGGLPNDYFNTSKFFISGNKKLKENGFKAPRHGRPLRKKSERRAVVVPKTILYLVLLGIFVLLCIILTLVHFGILQWKQYTTCLPNFTIGNCESMGFLDTYIWKEKKEYSVGMESCSYGVAFRTWAPLAAEVSVIVSNNSIGKTYQMRRQNDGCWFSNVCGVEEGMSYYYRIIGESGERTCKKLSLGSREIMSYSETSERSIISSSQTASSWKGENLSKAIIYQIFLPSFMDPVSSEKAFAQLSSKLSYFQSLGITALQFFPLEQYVCPSYIDISNCWQDISIQYPGVIHQDFGTFDQFRDFVDLAHSFNIAVYLEVNWSLFDSESIVYNIDCQLSEGSFLHSQASSTVGSRTRFDFNSLKKGRDYAEIIVTRWKQEVGVDGVIWNDCGCMIYDGQACQKAVGIRDVEGIQFLQWMIQNSTDFWHIADIKIPSSLVPFHAVYDNDLTSSLLSILSQNPINAESLSDLLISISSSSSSSSSTIFCYESRYTAETRFMQQFNLSDSAYRTHRVHSMGLAIVLASPLIPCLFMGTEFFTDVPFIATPNRLNLNFRNDVTKSEHGWVAITQDLISIRKRMNLAGSAMEIVWTDIENGLITYSLNTQDGNTVFVVINSSGNNYNMNNADLLYIPMPISLGKSSWSSLFSSESSKYDIHFDNDFGDLVCEICPPTLDSSCCVKPSIHRWSVRIFGN